LTSRYEASGTEAEFEPGSHGQVLKNLLGIKSPQAMDEVEAFALAEAMRALVGEYDAGHCFSARDIRRFHTTWLGRIYAWAGEYRQVNVSKDGFLFAAALRIPALMAEFERDVLARHTPCNSDDRPTIIGALAETHVELVLIHPFRDGNGRTARILSTLMALQADLPLLDFTLIAEEKRQAYFAAIQAGLARNYEPMERLFAQIIGLSLGST
jgi:cell filamentation protein, protein adenylyltransferase